MPYLILSAVFALLVYCPHLWVRFVMSKHAKNNDQIAGTGGELATHLLKRFDIDHVSVEETSANNDHYDPKNAVIRLSPRNFNGKSLTAIAVAAHEVGHAIQFQRAEAISQLRQRYLPTAFLFKKAGILLMSAIPIIAILVRSPAAIAVLIFLCLGLQLIGALSYLIVLPEEWDASFKKALPILIEGDYIEEADVPAVNSVLKAAALTYFAQALADLVNIGRWLIILRR